MRCAILPAIAVTSGAVLQRQGLLRDDAFGAAIAVEHAGVVEGRQKLLVVVVRMHEVQAAPARGFVVDRDRRAAQRQIEFAGQVQQAVADDLRFHADGFIRQ